MSDHPSSFSYRPHLDGVRALAVIAVFIFHAAPTALPGGFIGVDAFFVLSGFLITSILLGKVGRGEPWMADFYSRRVKRLLPAVLLVLLAVVVVAGVYEPPSEFAQRLSEVRATIFYFANWNLISSSDDYFAESFSVSPLRHMWSLAVEEQFYFVWPLVLTGLIALFGRRDRLQIPVIAAIVVSAYLLWYHYSPATVTRAYFGTDSRVFQPLMGSALAIALALHPTSTWGRWSRRTAWAAAGTVALTGLVVLTWMLDGNESAYFRWGAIAVGVLSLVVIIDGEVHPRSPVSRFLALKPLVLLGTISYGFYLWHWPVIQWIRPPDGADFVDRRLVNLAQFAVSLAAAVASYILVERPVRLGRSTARVTLPAALVGMLVVAGAAGVVLRTESTSITITTSGSRSVEPSPDDGIGASDGVETSDDGTIAPDEQLGEPTESTTTPADTTDDVVIEIVDPASDRSFEPCPDDPQPCVKVDGVTEEAPTVVLVGDSTAQAYDPALQVLAEQHGFRYVQAAVGGCPIGRRLLATGADGELHKPSNFMCFEETPGIYDRVVQEFEADLILATSWNETNQHVTEDGDLIERGTEQHIEQTRAELENSLDALTNDGAELVFIEVLPRGPSLDCLETSPADAGNCVRVVDDSGPEVPINELFGEFTRGRTDVLGTVSFLDRLCPDSACPLVLDDMVVRYDGTHFTGTQSRALAPELDAALLELGVELADLEDRGP